MRSFNAEQAPETCTTVASGRVGLFPVHFARTFSMQRLGPYDPTAELDGDCFRKAFCYRGEAAALAYCRDGDGIRICAYGGHADALLAEAVAGFEQDDCYHSFATEDSGVQRLHRMLPGLRVLRFPWLYDMTCSAILQQRIRTVDAMRDWRHIVQRWGGRISPGNADVHSELRIFPQAKVLARVPMHELLALGIDPRRARTLLTFARDQQFVPLKAESSFSRLRQQLLRISGIGHWTTETVLGFGAGDVDAAIPGDLHLPHVVCYALAGENPGSDERMLELLEPFRGHRFRIIRLLYASRLAVPRT